MSNILRLSKKIVLSTYNTANLNALIVGHGATGIIKDNICNVPEGINTVVIDSDNRLWEKTKDSLAEKECIVYHFDPYGEVSLIDIQNFFQKSSYSKYIFVNFGNKNTSKDINSITMLSEIVSKVKTRTEWYGERTDHIRFVFYDFSARGDIAMESGMMDLIDRSDMFNVSFLFTVRHIGTVEKVLGEIFVKKLIKIPNKVFGHTKNYENLSFYEDITGRSSREITDLPHGDVLVTIQENCILQDYGLTV